MDKDGMRKVARGLVAHSILRAKYKSDIAMLLGIDSRSGTPGEFLYTLAGRWSDLNDLDLSNELTKSSPLIALDFVSESEMKDLSRSESNLND